MPTSTGLLGLQQPVGSDAPSELRLSVTQHAAVLGDSFVPSYTLGASSMTATANDIVLAAPSVTVTLPAPTENAVVGVVTTSEATGTAPVTVAYGSDEIFGPGLTPTGVSSFTLGTPWSGVLLFANGGQWTVIAGVPDTGWLDTTSSTSGVISVST
jgi:hypothetical protein